MLKFSFRPSFFVFVICSFVLTSGVSAATVKSVNGKVSINRGSGIALPVYGDGRQVRDWLYVEDHVEALALVVETGRFGETYNIGGRAPMENNDTRAVVATTPNCQVTFDGGRDAGRERLFSTPAKFGLDLGWIDRIAPVVAQRWPRFPLGS